MQQNTAVPTKQISHDVITDYHGYRNEEPKDTLERVLDDEVGGASEQEQGDVGPGKL